MEPELLCLRNAPPGRTFPGAEPTDDMDPRRWAIRFVWICPTGVGVVVCERSAAAAAAAERFALELRLARKA